MAHAATAPEVAIPDLPRQQPAMRRRWPGLAGLALALAGLVATFAALRLEPAAQDVEAAALNAEAAAASAQQARITTYTVDDKNQIMVQGIDAQSRNAAIPVSALPVESVHAVQLASGIGNGTYGNALRCMTQAIYYEAGFEPEAGKRAVAQVVLNRMRHPAYPHSVCGVVYQGAERTTGCQFSFTCDGALLRPPAPGPWREAEAVARAALAGHVEPGVGTATHYHADYVLPKWAFEMAKIEKIGLHIFYRFDGAWGRASAFSASYSGIEGIPALNFAGLRQRLLAAGEGAAAQPLVPGLSVAPHVTDRHADHDVGGRLDVSKGWRLTFADPAATKSQFQQAVAQTEPAGRPAGEVASNDVAMTEVLNK
jgi:spore germination cell wall hydrolase CwlJ-like protein